MKQLIKTAIFTFSAMVMLPFTLLFHLLKLFFPGDSVLAGFSQALSLLPGKSGVILRGGFYRFCISRCAEDAVISFLTIFSQSDTEIEGGVYIGPQCNIGKCRIGKNTLLGSGVHVMSGKAQHNFDDLNTPIKDQGGVFSKVTIGENCWLGNGAMVMANIGNGAVIAAGSVVVNDIPDNVIAAGNPAKVIKSRV